MPESTISRALQQLAEDRIERARIIARSGGLENALAKGLIPHTVDLTVSEALVLGFLKQDVKRFFVVFGHGSTEIGEVLRIYSAEGLVNVYPVRSEVEASHAATALRWVKNEKAAVITSIGPGALHALAASIAPASNGIGVWYLFGDETTEDEGYNMQQIPKREQSLFLKMMSSMGGAYTLHTPNAVSVALRRGLNVVDHPFKGGPFYLLLPMNIQPMMLHRYNLDELPCGPIPAPGVATGEYETAIAEILNAKKVVVKVGGGARKAAAEIQEFLELADGVAVLSPVSTGVVAFENPRNMQVGGSKGSICGNYAMENADLLVVIGSRAVCQSDCSRTGYPGVKHVININADLGDSLHYNNTTPLIGDAAMTIQKLNTILKSKPSKTIPGGSGWLHECHRKRNEWEEYKKKRYQNPVLFDPFWKKEVLTQPAAIKIASDWARKKSIVTFFDSGDVQANGFQLVEDDTPERTFTEAGSSYMGFAASALLTTSVSSTPFYGLAIAGDGSFTMNPQILIDGVEHGANGCILLLDNNRMGAISSLQLDQFGIDFATYNQKTHIDYLQWARSFSGICALDGGNSPQSLLAALDSARDYAGLSFIYVPVYYGKDELGGLGVYGRWNVGNWCESTQELRHKIGI